MRQGKAGNTWQCATVTDIPSDVIDDLRLSSYYHKYTHAFKIPILGSPRVSDDALMRACYVARILLGDNRRVRQLLYERFTRIVVIADNEVTLNIPEYSHLKAEYSDLVRGLGGTEHIPVISVGEENLLCDRKDPNKREDTLVRAIAQGMHKIALLPSDVTRQFEFELQDAYTYARRQKLWTRTISDDTVEAYFSEGVQSFFNVQAPAKDGLQNDVDSRSKLKYYDTKLYSILSSIFPCQNELVDRCASQSKYYAKIVDEGKTSY